jgi:predicted HicB family RNase H-like nuclease
MLTSTQNIITILAVAREKSSPEKDKVKIVGFRLLEDKHKELRIAAIRERTSVNEILNRLVDEYLTSRKDQR